MAPEFPLELRHLRAFVAVAETLHFARAAERLGMSQPPVSQLIARLERRIGHPLFERSRAGRRRVSLTGAGEALLPRARQLLADAAQALGTVRAAARGATGTLRVAFVGSLGSGVLSRAVRDHRLRRPDAVLELREWTSAPIVDAVLSGEVDLGIGRELAAHPELTVRRLFREPLRLVLPADHWMARGSQPRSSSSRSDLDLVLPPRAAGQAFGERLLEAAAAAGIAPRLVQEATEWPTILALVAAGLGASIVPASALLLRPAGLVVRALAGRRATTCVQAIWRSDTRSPTRDGFLASLVDATSELRRTRTPRTRTRVRERL